MNDDWISLEIDNIYEGDELSGEQRLWREVVAMALQDAYGIKSGASELEEHLAKRWLDMRVSNFRFVCGMAGYEPEYILRIAGKMMARKGG